MTLLVGTLIFFKEKAHSSNFFGNRALEANTEYKVLAMTHPMEVRLSIRYHFITSKLDWEPEL